VWEFIQGELEKRVRRGAVWGLGKIAICHIMDAKRRKETKKNGGFWAIATTPHGFDYILCGGWMI